MKVRRKLRRRVRRRAAPAVRGQPGRRAHAARQDARAQMQGEAALMIGGARDPAEQAADRLTAGALAAGVTAPSGSRAPGTVHRKCAACAGGGGACPACAGKGAAEQPVERAPAAGQIAAPGTAAAPASARAARAIGSMGAGRPLARAERAFFEPRFGRDFSGVRVHQDAAADRAARAIDARAFAWGRDVAFAEGGLDRSTMAHELAHVAQSTGHEPVQFRRQTEESPEQRGQVEEGQPQAPLRTTGCTGGENGTVPQSRDPVAEIRQAIGVANGMIGHAQATFGSAAGGDQTARGQVRANFSHRAAPANWPTARQIGFIQNKYREIAGWLNSRDGPRIVCRTSDSPGCRSIRHRGRDLPVEGFTICDANRPVYLCARSFGGTPRHLAEILIHEAAHRKQVCPPGDATECYHFEGCYPPRNAHRVCADSYSTLADRSLQAAIEARERSQPREREPFVPPGVRDMFEEF